MSGNQAHLRKTGSPISGGAEGAYPEGPYAEGLALAAAGRHGEAIASFEKALEKRPDDSHTLFALGVTAQEIGHTPAAETFFRRVLAQEPDRIEALVQLAQVMRSGGRFSEVIGLLTPALERKPETPELWLTLGNALRESGDRAHARSFYDEAVRLKPDYAAALGNIADLIADDGRTDDALALYKRVLSLEPHQAQARLNRAILLLSRGELARGWRDYAYRIHCKGKVPTPTHGLPKWNGRVMKRTRLLVTSEQGVGDQIAFASMIPDLANWAAQAGGEIILEAEPRLVPLFARSFPGITVMPADLSARGGRITAHYDWLEKAGGATAAVEMGTLAQHLRRKLTEFPDRTSYLSADENLSAEFAQWLRGHGDGPTVGLCWRSGKSGGLRNQNFAPLEMWAAFARDLPGTLVSLQYDATPEEIIALEAMTGRRVIAPEGLDQKREIDRTAALMAALDAVVSAPTAVSWTTAALGIPTYKLLYNTSWMSFGQDYEPFAPSCRCIMPERSGDWAEVFTKAGQTLQAQFAI